MLFAEKYPATTTQIGKQLYVEDYLGGADTLASAKQMIKKTLIIGFLSLTLLIVEIHFQQLWPEHMG